MNNKTNDFTGVKYWDRESYIKFIELHINDSSEYIIKNNNILEIILGYFEIRVERGWRIDDDSYFSSFFLECLASYSKRELIADKYLELLSILIEMNILENRSIIENILLNITSVRLFEDIQRDIIHYGETLRRFLKMLKNSMTKGLLSNIQISCYYKGPYDIELADLFLVLNADNKEILCNACAKSDVEVINYILSFSNEYRTRTSCLDRPLLEAVKNNNLSVVKMLLKYNANPNVADAYASALEIAIGENNVGIINALIEAGADVKSHCLELAINKNDIELLKRLLKNNSDVNSVMIYAVHNNEEIVDLLLEYGADINETSIYRRTLLFFSNYINTKKLIDLGLDINAKDEQGDTPLSFTVYQSQYYDNIEKIRLLLHLGANVHVWNNKGDSIFDYQYNEDTFLLLVEKLNNSELDSLFLEVITKSNYRVFNYCIRYFKRSNIKLCGEVIEKALYESIKSLKVDYVGGILSLCKNVNSLLLDGMHPLVYALKIKIDLVPNKNEYNHLKIYEQNRNNKRAVVKSLINAGASISVIDNEGNNPLIMALMDFFYQYNLLKKECFIPGLYLIPLPDDILEKKMFENLNFYSFYELIKMFIKLGCNINHKNHFGETALIIAAKKQNCYLVDLFLSNGADIRIIDKKNKTAYMHIKNMRQSIKIDIFNYLTKVLLTK